MVKVLKPSPRTLQQDSSKHPTRSQIKKVKVKQTKVNEIELSNENEIMVSKGVKKFEENAAMKNKGTLKNVDVESGKKIVNEKSVNPNSLQKKNVHKYAKKKLAQHKPDAEERRQETVSEPTLDRAQKRKAAIKAFNKNQKKKREDIDKNNEKPTSSSKTQFEAVAFDEKKFGDIVNLKNIQKIAEALKTLVEKEVTERKTSIFSDYRYFLNVSSYKISNCPKRMVKLNLKHSLVDTNTDDVVIIVPDLQRGAKVDYEPTIQHYDDMFREIGINNLKIVPFNQLRNECTTFETKRKFANTYDYFLCDGRIVSHVVGFCGKHFQKPRTTFHAVRLDNPKTYKSDVERALKRTSYKQLEKGDLISIPVGNHRFSVNQLSNNVQMVIDQLKSIFPGGLANIRNIHMKIDIKGTSSMPLYFSLTGAPSETPNVIGTREQRMLKLKKEANDILSKFSLSKTGDLVKLNKTQVKRKQQMRDARETLLSTETIEASNEGVQSSKEVGVEEAKKNQIKLNPIIKKDENNREAETETEEGSEVDDVDNSEDEDDDESVDGDD